MAALGLRFPITSRCGDARSSLRSIRVTARQVTATSQARMDPVRKTALVAGVFYLLTFVSSIPAVFLLDPVLNDPDFIVGSGADGRVVLGCLLDLVNAIACVGTAVALFPIVKRQNE